MCDNRAMLKLAAFLLSSVAFAQFTPPPASTVSLPVSVANGGTGATTLAAAGIPTLTQVQQNATRCLDASATDDGSVAHPIICNTTPSFTAGSGTVIWVAFSAANNASGLRVNLNGGGAKLTQDPCSGNNINANLLAGSGSNGNSYYPLAWDDLNSVWIVPGPCNFAVGGASAVGGTNAGKQLVGDTAQGTIKTGSPALYTTASNCSSSASPAVCSAAPAGSIAFPTGVTSVALTVNSTAVTANSQIFWMSDDTLGTKLSVTCNSTLATLVGGVAVTARVAATSFTFTYSGTIATNPLCGSYFIIN